MPIVHKHQESLYVHLEFGSDLSLFLSGLSQPFRGSG